MDSTPWLDLDTRLDLNLNSLPHRGEAPVSFFLSSLDVLIWVVEGIYSYVSFFLFQKREIFQGAFAGFVQKPEEVSEKFWELIFSWLDFDFEFL